MYLTWLAYHQSVGDTTTTDIDVGIKGALAHALLSLSATNRYRSSCALGP
jgi:hypothetical protein